MIYIFEFIIIMGGINGEGDNKKELKSYLFGKDNWLIWLGHILFFAFMIIAPFTNNETILKYHADIVIGLIVKWVILNKCTIVKFEKMIRGVSTEESFVFQFLEPLVDLRYKKEIWMPIVVLGLISFYKWRNM